MCIKSVKNMQLIVRFSKYVVMFILLSKVIVQATTNFVSKFYPLKIIVFVWLYFAWETFFFSF